VDSNENVRYARDLQVLNELLGSVRALLAPEARAEISQNREALGLARDQLRLWEPTLRQLQTQQQATGLESEAACALAAKLQDVQTQLSRLNPILG